MMANGCPGMRFFISFSSDRNFAQARMRGCQRDKDCLKDRDKIATVFSKNESRISKETFGAGYTEKGPDARKSPGHPFVIIFFVQSMVVKGEELSVRAKIKRNGKLQKK